jgi:hypothetical protein
MNSKNCDSSQATSCCLSAFPLCFDMFRHQTNGTRSSARRFWDQNFFAESILELVGMEMEELGRPGLAAGVCPDLGRDPVVAVFFFPDEHDAGKQWVVCRMF